MIPGKIEILVNKSFRDVPFVGWHFFFKIIVRGRVIDMGVWLGRVVGWGYVHENLSKFYHPIVYHPVAAKNN